MENMDLGQLAEQLFQGVQLDTDMLVKAVSEGNIGGAISNETLRNTNVKNKQIDFKEICK